MSEHDTQRRIVVGVDGSTPSKQALRWAIEQAGLTGAVVDAVNVWDYPVSYGWGPAYDSGIDLAKIAEELLTETVAEVTAEVTGERPPVPVRTTVLEGHPAYLLIQAADGADLLVLGCRGHGGFVGALLGSVSQYCVQHATCPVVVIRGPHD
jgi:nucleotide-binding universal stress UspA family protein